MALDLLRGRGRGVAELALDVDQRQPGGQPRGGGGVAQVVQAQRRSQPRVLERVLVHVARDVRARQPPRGPRNTRIRPSAGPPASRSARRTPSSRAPKSTERKRSPFVEPYPWALRERSTRRLRSDQSTSAHTSPSASLIRRPVAISVSASGR